MNKNIIIILISLITISCSQFNKGVVSKRELRKKKPQSVRIAEEYDKKAKKGPKAKTYSNPKRAERAKARNTKKHKKKANRYLKKKKRKLK